jgi:mono/diheme cytochrome c family protein
VNRAQKEAYKRDYAAAKADGKPFFPYAVYKDLLIATLAIGVVIFMAVWQRVGVAPPVNPATTDYVPRPDWYFLFLFELLRIFKNQNALTPVIMGSFIIPNVLMVLLLVTPFIDRGPERRIWRRPIALVSGIAVIFFLAYLTYLGATAPEPVSGKATIPLTIPPSDTQAQAGLKLFLANPCLNCHMIKGTGGSIGPNLTNEGTKPGHDKAWQIRHLKCPSCVDKGSSMPAFNNFTPQEYDQLATFLTGLGTKYK